MSHSAVRIVLFTKSRLLFNVFYRFCMFVNKYFAYLKRACLKNWKVLYEQFEWYCFLYGDEFIAEFLYMHSCTFKFSCEIYEFFRSSNQRCFMKKAVLKNFAISQTCNFIKKRLQHKWFPLNTTKFPTKNSYFEKHLLMAATDSFVMFR